MRWEPFLRVVVVIGTIQIMQSEFLDLHPALLLTLMLALALGFLIPIMESVVNTFESCSMN